MQKHSYKGIIIVAVLFFFYIFNTFDAIRFFINKNDMKGGQSEKQKKEKLVKKINKQI